MKKSLFCLCMAVVFWHGYACAGYVDNNDGTITDTSTGLMWEKSTGLTTNTYTWEGAKAYCENLTLGGQSDWRLPTRNELQTIVDYNKYDPSIDTTFFPDAKASYYWSSTVNASTTYNAWYVYFYYGYVGYYDKADYFYVRAVRAGQCGSLGSSTTTTASGGTTTTIPGGDNSTSLRIIPKKLHKILGMIEPIKFMVLIADKNNVISVDDDLSWCSDALTTMLKLNIGKRVMLVLVRFKAHEAEVGECQVMMGDYIGNFEITAF